jgi:hypothetical protein
MSKSNIKAIGWTIRSKSNIKAIGWTIMSKSNIKAIGWTILVHPIAFVNFTQYSPSYSFC